MSKKKHNHHRDCTVALLKHLKINEKYLTPERIYCAPHGRCMRDIVGLWDTNVWIPCIKKELKIACSCWAKRKMSLADHDLLNKDNYIFNDCYEYYLVTWQIKKHKKLFRFFTLPDMKELI